MVNNLGIFNEQGLEKGESAIQSNYRKNNDVANCHSLLLAIKFNDGNHYTQEMFILNVL